MFRKPGSDDNKLSIQNHTQTIDTAIFYDTDDEVEDGDEQNDDIEIIYVDDDTGTIF